MEVNRDDTTLVLSEHYGDGSPGAKVFIEVDDLDYLQRELADRHNPHMRPGIEAADWGRILTVIDPFANKLVFCCRSDLQRTRTLTRDGEKSRWAQ